MRYAVVMKTYAWDAFVHRQAARCEAAAPSGDFFLSIDETNGSVGAVPFPRVIRTSNAEILGMGFAGRSEHGAMLWWNADYAHYQFRALHPEYDYYVFVEFDAVVQGNLDAIVAQVAERNLDFVALPVREKGADYFWTLPHLQTYRAEEMAPALICISISSARALDRLASRRREMGSDDTLRYWPAAEVFVGTEIARAGYSFCSLDQFGDASRYVWFPPVLEQDVPEQPGPAFFHPVLDQARYIRSIINNNTHFRSFLYWRSTMYRKLSRFSRQEYASLLPGAARRRLRMSLKLKFERTRLRLTKALNARSSRGDAPSS